MNRTRKNISNANDGIGKGEINRAKDEQENWSQKGANMFYTVAKQKEKMTRRAGEKQ